MRRAELALGVGVAAMLLFAAPAAAMGPFAKLPASMTEGRYAPGAAVLPDGRVLVVGGYIEGGKPLKTAELFDPTTGTFTKLAAEMATTRGELGVVPLPGGKVLIAGGYTFTPKGAALASAEIFDPTTGAFTAAHEMKAARDGPAAAALPNGKVLLSGGDNSAFEALKSAELFDPATGTFETLASEPLAGRYQPAAVALPGGKVLIAGGSGKAGALKTAELFNPETNTFEALTGPTHEMLETGNELAGTLLQNGRALIFGDYLGGAEAARNVELFNPATNTFENFTSKLAEPRVGPAAVTLDDGRALVVGGVDTTLVGPKAYLASAETSTPAAPAATSAPASALGTTTATLNGTVLTEAFARVVFQYGTSTAYGATAPAPTPPVSSLPGVVSVPVSGLAAGTGYHFRILAEGAGGPSAGADETFTTVALPSPVVPVISAASETHKTWREAAKGASFSRRRPPVGTKFSYTLNVAAGISYEFTQRVGGRSVGKRCVAQTHANGHRRSCKRTITRAILTHAGHLGTNALAFYGRIAGKRRLAPGTYTLVVTASAAGLRSAPARLTFTIVR
jgi:hypothetical protein